jgi:hypothetical protein
VRNGQHGHYGHQCASTASMSRGISGASVDVEQFTWRRARWVAAGSAARMARMLKESWLLRRTCDV